MAIQRGIAEIGIAKQTAKGSAAANPTYLFGVQNGAVATADIVEDDLNVTSVDLMVDSKDRKQVLPGAAFTTTVEESMIGLLLMGALGTDVKTGAGDPYTHTFTPATTRPYLTLFSRLGADYLTGTDFVVDSLEFTFDQAGRLDVKPVLKGLDLDYLASAYTGGTAERPKDGVFKGVSGTMSIDGAAAKIVSGSVTINNRFDPLYIATGVLPDDLVNTQLEVRFSLNLKPNDTTLFRKVLTGAAGGTSVATAPYYGAVNLKWVADANTDLDITTPRVAYMCQFPDADATGGAAEVKFEGQVVRAVSGANVTVALRNAVSTAY